MWKLDFFSFFQTDYDCHPDPCHISKLAMILSDEAEKEPPDLDALHKPPILP